MFDKNYFEDGVNNKISNYEDYRWMPDRTIKDTKYIKSILQISNGCKVLDFGCAKGFMVKAFRLLNVDAYGCDISDYAINNVDSTVKDYCYKISDINSMNKINLVFDHIVCNHVLEHIEKDVLLDTLLVLRKNFQSSIFIRIPIGDELGYIFKKHNNDITHKICESQGWWLEIFKKGNLKLKYKKYLSEEGVLEALLEKEN